MFHIRHHIGDIQQVILVGHSAGGLSITQASHKFPKKIRLAIYVAATMLKLGFRTDEDLKDVSNFQEIWCIILVSTLNVYL